MKKPQDFPNRILLTIAGSSPAIVTETLYALSQQDEPFIPTEIHIITTSGVVGKIKETLLGTTKKNGAIEELCHDYKLKLPYIDQSTIHIISDKSGNQLNDIVTEDDNEATANFIVNKVRELTGKKDSCLHVSIAGGRKTMTYYLGYAMSVFGRIQDQMSHVLVENDIRSHDFFYPTPETKMLKAFDETEFDASKVKVMLGYLPYIRLRDGLTDDLLQDENKTYSEIIEVAQRQLVPLEVTLKNGKLYCAGRAVTLADADLSLYIWVLDRHKKQSEPLSFTTKEQQREHTDNFLSVYKKCSNSSEHYYKLKEDTFTDACPMDTKYFGEHRTKINTAIEEALGKPAATPYLIQSSGKRGSMSYSLSEKLHSHHIDIPSIVFNS